MSSRNSPQAVLRALVAVARAEQLTFLAAAIAYYAFVSLVPLVILGLAAASVVGGGELARSAIGTLDGVLTPEAAGLFEQALVAGAGREGATLLGLFVLAWSGLRVFRGLDVAFSRIYGAAEPKPLLAQVRDGTVVLGAIVVASAIVAGAVAVLRLAPLPFVDVFGPLPTVVGLVATFLPIYYVFPDRRIGVREALPGALFAAAGWTVLAWLFAAYVATAGMFQLYGLLGGVLLALAWFYAGAVTILLGATLNAVLAGRVDNRQLQLESHRGAT